MLRCSEVDTRHPQFQSLLKAFKSEALSFNDLLTGASETRRYERLALMLSRITEMAAVLRAQKDPALFALWGSFVPPEHLVCPRSLARPGFAIRRVHRLSSLNATCSCRHSIRPACFRSRPRTPKGPKRFRPRRRCLSFPDCDVSETTEPRRPTAQSCPVSVEVREELSLADVRTDWRCRIHSTKMPQSGAEHRLVV